MSVEKAERIMPAEAGWGAALARFDFNAGMQLWAEPLCGWALTRDSEGDSTVAGLVVHPDHPTLVIACYEVRAETGASDDPVYFEGYLRPGQSIEDYREEATEHYESWRKREAQDRALLNAGWTEHPDEPHDRRWEAPDGRTMHRLEALQEVGGSTEGNG